MEKTTTKQADLEEFLSKEVSDAIKENKVSNGSQKESDGFFIPKEETVPNTEKENITDPFKEAEFLNANTSSKEEIDKEVIEKY